MATSRGKVLDRIAGTARHARRTGASTASAPEISAKPRISSAPARRTVAATVMLLVTAGTGAALVSPAAAATKPGTLQSVGQPSVTASCKGGSYRRATPNSPMTTISGQKWTSGFSLTGTNCNTYFTWRLKTQYSTFKATVQLDAANSGPLTVQFRSGSVPVKFQVSGKTVSQLKVNNRSSVQVNLRGLSQLSIVLPNPGSDAGILDVTTNSLS